MKITGRGPINPFQLYSNSQQLNNKRGNSSLKGDTLELSPEAQQVREFTRLAEELPEVRVDLIEKIKSQMKEQTYHISPEQLATSILAYMAGEK